MFRSKFVADCYFLLLECFRYVIVSVLFDTENTSLVMYLCVVTVCYLEHSFNNVLVCCNCLQLRTQL